MARRVKTSRSASDRSPALAVSSIALRTQPQGRVRASGGRHETRPLRALIGATALLGCLLIVMTGCTGHDPATYTGKIVDEWEQPISGVEIKVCYVGWNWDEGGLTMDHSFCSETASSDEQGRYRIEFAAPPSAFLLARKPGWIQGESVLARNDHVVMIRMKDYLERQSERDARAEAEFRKRKPGESDHDYYCRVIRPRSGEVELDYHGQPLKIFQTLMNNGNLLFAAEGDYKAVSSMSGDVSVSVEMDGREVLADDFHAAPETVSCDNGIFYVQTHSPVSPSGLLSVDRVHLSLSSVHAGFMMEVWKEE